VVREERGVGVGDGSSSRVTDGRIVGVNEGKDVRVTVAEGSAEGDGVGVTDGSGVGVTDGRVVGVKEGSLVGVAEGREDGEAEGTGHRLTDAINPKVARVDASALGLYGTVTKTATLISSIAQVKLVFELETRIMRPRPSIGKSRRKVNFVGARPIWNGMYVAFSKAYTTADELTDGLTDANIFRESSYPFGTLKKREVYVRVDKDCVKT